LSYWISSYFYFWNYSFYSIYSFYCF